MQCSAAQKKEEKHQKKEKKKKTNLTFHPFPSKHPKKEYFTSTILINGYIFGLPLDQDASHKWRFSSGFPVYQKCFMSSWWWWLHPGLGGRVVPRYKPTPLKKTNERKTASMSSGSMAFSGSRAFNSGLTVSMRNALSGKHLQPRKKSLGYFPWNYRYCIIYCPNI